MAIVVVFAAFLFLSMFVKRHIGPTILAVLAGHGIYASFGPQFVAMIQKVLTGVPTETIDLVLYVALVIGLPLVLYLKAGGTGLYGLARTAEGVAFAAIATSMLAKPLAMFFSFDDTSVQLYNLIQTNLSPIMMAGIIAAYLDIIFYRDPR